MKKFLVFCAAFFLFACEKNSEKVGELRSEKVKTVGVDEKCNSTEKLFCDPGLECELNLENPEIGGICIETVVDKNLECDEKKEPVCALKNNRKNGFLNRCEARRHGAEILHEKFCEKNDVAGDCSAKVLAVNFCEQIFSGFEFDGENCVEKKVVGCDAEIPFVTKIECEQKCKN